MLAVGVRLNHFQAGCDILLDQFATVVLVALYGSGYCAARMR